MNPSELAKLRKRRLILRQTAIFGLLIAVLVVAGVAGAAMYLGRIDPILSVPLSSPSAAAQDFGPMPCPKSETAKYPRSDKVTVNVLNGSKMTGAARYLAQALESRGFLIGRVDNSPVNYLGSALIRTGQRGINRAYTLLAHAPTDAVLAYSAREDNSVDIIIGDNYEGPRPLDQVTLEAGTVIPFPEACTQLEELIGTAPADSEQTGGAVAESDGSNPD